MTGKLNLDGTVTTALAGLVTTGSIKGLFIGAALGFTFDYWDYSGQKKYKPQKPAPK